MSSAFDHLSLWGVLNVLNIPSVRSVVSVRSVLAILSVLICVMGTHVAQADDTLRLTREPGSFTDIADAADGDDPFDLNLHLGFRRTQLSGTLQREPGTGDARTNDGFVDIGEWSEVRNTLELGLDIGIYHDVMVYARLPLILSDDRSIVYPDDGLMADVDTRLRTPGATAAPLFNLPFESPTRSGIDTLTLGLGFSVMNQARSPNLPTWTLLLESRLGIGSLLDACEAGDDSCVPGISRGTHALRIETRLSRRYRFAEVFSGLSYEYAWAGAADGEFAPNGHLAGYQNRQPPMRGTFEAGVSFVPWEQRERQQRFSFEFRARGTYVSEGRDYSPLFDALGSSSNAHLTSNNLEGILAGTALRETPFNGLTDVQDRGELGGTIAIELQAARYVKFRVGLDIDYITPYLLTNTDACNVSAEPSGPEDPRRGPSPDLNDDGAYCTRGLINPHYRATLDTPGSRFRLGGGLRTRIFVQATAQF